MSGAPPGSGQELAATPGVKPTIAEVAAWLRGGAGGGEDGEGGEGDQAATVGHPANGPSVGTQDPSTSAGSSDPGAPEAHDDGPAASDEEPSPTVAMSLTEIVDSGRDQVAGTTAGASTAVDETSVTAAEPARPAAVSLFNLDLAELAARARSSAALDAPATDDRNGDERAQDDLADPVPANPTAPTMPAAPEAPAASVTSPATPVTPVPAPARPTGGKPPDADEAQAGPTAPDADATSTALIWEEPAAYGPTGDDLHQHNEPSARPPEPVRSLALDLLGGVRAAAAKGSRRPIRSRYPRGQLRERIGVLRRIRAMLGVIVVTVVLGIAAGAAVGAFFLFLTFAIRSAINSG